MTVEEVKLLIQSVKSTERESKRLKQEIERRREELLSIRSTLGGSERVVSSEKLSMPERVYFALEKLYTQYSDALQRLYDSRAEIERVISTLDPIEREIVYAWIDGKTEEQVGAQVGYTGRTVRNYKKRILIKLSMSKSLPPIS